MANLILGFIGGLLPIITLAVFGISYKVYIDWREKKDATQD